MLRCVALTDSVHSEPAKSSPAWFCPWLQTNARTLLVLFFIVLLQCRYVVGNWVRSDKPLNFPLGIQRGVPALSAGARLVFFFACVVWRSVHELRHLGSRGDLVQMHRPPVGLRSEDMQPQASCAFWREMIVYYRFLLHSNRVHCIVYPLVIRA